MRTSEIQPRMCRKGLNFDASSQWMNSVCFRELNKYRHVVIQRHSAREEECPPCLVYILSVPIRSVDTHMNKVKSIILTGLSLNPHTKITTSRK